MSRATLVLLSTIGAWFVAAVGICLVATLSVSEEARSPWFWYRMLWTEILAALVWGAAYLFVGAAGGKDRHGLFALVPLAKMAILLYAGGSFAVMMVHAFIPASSPADRIHLLVQVVFAVVILITVMLLGVTAGTASNANEQSEDFSFGSTCALIHQHELRLRQFPVDRVWNELRTSLKTLREIMESALPPSFSSSSLPKAIRLREDIARTCEQLFEYSDPAETQLAAIGSHLSQLKAELIVLSNSHVVLGR